MEDMAHGFVTFPTIAFPLGFNTLFLEEAAHGLRLIPEEILAGGAECCSTGRLKRGYGVEAMLRLLSGSRTYRETHNAFHDAFDELEIMRLLAHPLDAYPKL